MLQQWNHRMGGVTVLTAVLALLGGCHQGAVSRSAADRSAQAQWAGGTWRQHRSLVALGDSVPNGANCDCNPYPVLLAKALTASRGLRVTAFNDAADGFTTSDVLDQLTNDRGVIADVKAADVVTIEVGANDVQFSTDCRTVVSCYAPQVPAVRRGLAAILARVKALTAGRDVRVVMLDYWNVWLGGQYAASRGPAYVAAADAVTDKVNAAIRAVAARGNASYVDLRAAFKGPAYTRDETALLSNDGDHPSPLGHALIAKAVMEVLQKPIRG